jgi:hypothetical protein
MQAKNQFDIQKMEHEAQLKKLLMAEEFKYQMQLAQVNAQAQQSKLNTIEDRKDNRLKTTATQQSELIDQRQNKTMPKDFESAGFDNMSGFDLAQFEPK